MLVYSLIVLIILVLLPQEAFAWGPGMHTYVAMDVLAKLAITTPIIKKLLESFPNDFLYGAVSPDIVVGKKYVENMHHCHNWRVGWLILSEARSDRQRAAAYGYLVHLAADTVAHNYYIPYKVVRSYKARMLSHTYWEMRFDLGLPEKVWKKLDSISEHDSHEFDLLLDRVLRKTIFSFKTNKRIFSSILALQKMRGLRDGLKIYDKRSRWKVEKENRMHYLDLTLEAVEEFIKKPNYAGCLDVDPTGISRLTYAKNLRRRMKALYIRGVLKESSADTLIELVRERLAVGLYMPDLILPDVTDVLFV